MIRIINAFQIGKSAANFLLPILIAGAAIVATGQNHDLQQPPLPVDPTPIKDLLTDAERALVADPHAYKKTVEAYLAISDVHLEAAAKAVDEGGTSAAERELDIFSKSAAEACRVAFDAQAREAKSSLRAALGKRIEQRLYIQIKRLEAIQRRFPSERVGFAEAALTAAKKLRDHALNETLAFGDVLTEHSGKKKEVDAGPPPEFFRFDFHGTGANVLPPAGVMAVSYQDGADYLSEDEENSVKEAQDIDRRAKIFMKIADRRLQAIATASDLPSTAKPDPNKRPHELRKGEADDSREGDNLDKLSRAELLRHYARAIEELMDKMEDAHERNPKSTALKRALTTLADATDRQLKTLRALKDMQDEAEDRALRAAIDKAEEANKGAREALNAKP